MQKTSNNQNQKQSTDLFEKLSVLGLSVELIHIHESVISLPKMDDILVVGIRMALETQNATVAVLLHTSTGSDEIRHLSCWARAQSRKVKRRSEESEQHQK